MKKFIVLVLMAILSMGMSLGPKDPYEQFFRKARTCRETGYTVDCVSIKGDKGTVCWCRAQDFSISCTCMPPEDMSVQETIEYIRYWTLDPYRFDIY